MGGESSLLTQSEPAVSASLLFFASGTVFDAV